MWVGYWGRAEAALAAPGEGGRAGLGPHRGAGECRPTRKCGFVVPATGKEGPRRVEPSPLGSTLVTLPLG